MNPGLLVPLTLLPGTVPVGAVVRITLDFCYGRRAVVVLPPCKALPYMVCVALLGSEDDEDTGQVIALNIEHLSLDLSEPPTEDTGRPTHVDGVVVLAGMLARAMGLGVAVVVWDTGEVDEHDASTGRCLDHPFTALPVRKLRREVPRG